MVNANYLAPRRCLLEPIPEIFEAARLLEAAVDAHLAGNPAAASRLIEQADISTIADWSETLWGSVKEEVHRYRDVDGAPPVLPKEKRLGNRMPSSADKRRIIERDGLLCRFCGIPVVDERVRKAVRTQYSTTLRWGSTNVEQHAAFQCMWLQYDHVLPYSRGGDSSVANVVVTCAPCNFGRREFTLAEVGLIDPRTLPIQQSPWDGLERFLNS